jgi:predicted  nucleic acid-binding Zn-ribbon protein
MDLELANFPDLVTQLESKIQLENDTIATATQELQNLEIQSKSLENEINSLSEQIDRQKNKQLTVKKNEEYLALESEIANLLRLQSEQEDEQIGILVKIDEARETEKIAKEKISVKVKLLENDKLQLLDRGEELKIELKTLEKEVEDSRAEVEPPLLSGYDRTKKVVSRPPYIAPLEDQKCSGCNLRVSNDVVSSALVEQKLTHCDQCGRIVYSER